MFIASPIFFSGKYPTAILYPLVPWLDGNVRFTDKALGNDKLFKVFLLLLNKSSVCRAPV